MKKVFLIITMIIIGIMGCMPICYGQNNIQKVKTLFVINYDSNKATASVLISHPNDIARMYIPDKSEAIKALGPVDADVIVYVTLKPNIKLLTLPMIYDAFNIGAENRNLPVRVDGLQVLNPNDILAVRSEIYKISVENNYIDIATKTKLAHDKKK